MIFLAQLQPTPQLPELPEGPSLDRVRGPVEIPAYEPWQIALAVIFVLIAVGVVLWLFFKTRRIGQIETPPYEAAIAELDTASSLTQGDDERFAVMCSQALRRYLENGLGLKFSARTSEEFLRSLKGNTHLESEFQDELAQVLHAFDQIKFARAGISAEKRNEISDTVRRLIDQAHRAQRQEGASQ